MVRLEGPGGVPLALVQRGGIEFDLDHVLLRLPEREAALARARDDGLRAPRRRPRGGQPRAAHRRTATRADGERPLLNHIALLVDSAGEVQREAEERGVEIDDIKDAPNTLAVFLRGPSGVRIEYVEHKPGFALV